MPTYEIPVGDHVECDMCSKDLTSDPASGGFVFASNGVGPCCAERVEASAKQYGEESFISARCPEGVSYADWIRDTVRGGVPAAIQVLTGQEAVDYMRRRTG